MGIEASGRSGDHIDRTGTDPLSSTTAKQIPNTLLYQSAHIHGLLFRPGVYLQSLSNAPKQSFSGVLSLPEAFSFRRATLRTLPLSCPLLLLVLPPPTTTSLITTPTATAAAHGCYPPITVTSHHYCLLLLLLHLSRPCHHCYLPLLTDRSRPYFYCYLTLLFLLLLLLVFAAPTIATCHC